MSSRSISVIERLSVGFTCGRRTWRPPPAPRFGTGITLVAGARFYDAVRRGTPRPGVRPSRPSSHPQHHSYHNEGTRFRVATMTRWTFTSKMLLGLGLLVAGLWGAAIGAGYNTLLPFAVLALLIVIEGAHYLRRDTSAKRENPENLGEDDE